MTDETARRYTARRRLWDGLTARTSLRGKRVLDAGTGEGHLTTYLAERGAAEVVSVCLFPEEAADARRRLGPLAEKVRFELADLAATPPPALGRFDVVFGDFLIAAAASYTPYREDVLVENLASLTAPGGALLLTGWQVDDASRRFPSALTRHVAQAFAFRTAVGHLTGREPFREHPADWTARHVARLGLLPEPPLLVPDEHRDWSWFFGQVEEALAAVRADDLRAALTNQWGTLRENVRAGLAAAPGFVFGELWGVAALQTAGALVLDGLGQEGGAAASSPAQRFRSA